MIESVFGSYKQYVARDVWSEIGSNVLLLPVVVVTLTVGLVRQALMAVRGSDVRPGCVEHLGPSRQQRFGQVFVKAKRPATQAAHDAERPPPKEDPAACRVPPSGSIAA